MFPQYFLISADPFLTHLLNILPHHQHQHLVVPAFPKTGSCSQRYFSVVPLFPKTPGRLSVKKGFSSISAEVSQPSVPHFPHFLPGFLPSCPLPLQKFCVWLITAFCFFFHTGICWYFLQSGRLLEETRDRRRRRRKKYVLTEILKNK